MSTISDVVTFRDFEKQVIRQTCTPLLGDQLIDTLLSDDNRFWLEFTGSGYFLTTRNNNLSLPVRRLEAKSVKAVTGETSAGFTIYLHEKRLTLECFNKDQSPWPRDFRERQPVLLNNTEAASPVTGKKAALTFRHRFIRTRMRLGIDRMVEAGGLGSGPLLIGSLKTIRPTYVIALLAVAALVLFIRQSNPYRIYSSERFWDDATLADVSQIPAEALAPGNRNGSVLMWAAIASDDPAILTALVERGAEVNEGDVVFSGTPLSGAAGFSDNPAIIDELVRLGADIHKVVGSNDKSPLIIAAELNENPAIIERLLFHGADAGYTDSTGRTALQQAQMNGNEPAIRILREHLQLQ